jgi:hypothetical protein
MAKATVSLSKFSPPKVNVLEELDEGFINELDVDERIKELLTMLTYCRSSGSEGERQFIERFILSLPDAYALEYDMKAGKETYTDVAAYVVEVVDPATNTYPPVLFSAHTDSVHQHKAGPRQPVKYDADFNMVFTDYEQPLGADDAAGVWIMRQMIAAQVPGVYVFPCGEECGGVGSQALADHYAEWLQQFDYAIAFDRRGTADVITHQGMGRCASDAFGDALAAALNVEGLDYKSSDQGVFTDTANWTELIPECTNLSCGYYHEHTKDEQLDVRHVTALADAAINIFWDELPVKRVAEPVRYEPWPGLGGRVVDPWSVGYEPFVEEAKVEEMVDELAYMTLKDMKRQALDDPDMFAKAVFMYLNGTC